MNLKHASVFAGSVGSLAIASMATAGFNGMAWQSVENNGLGDNPTTGDTYRLVAMMDMGDRLDAVAGNETQGLSLTSNGYFYQNALGGPTSTSINSGFFPLAPSLEWDSYVTIGALYANGDPFDDNGLNNIGVDWADFEAGGDLYTQNGTWFVTPDMPQGEAMAHEGLWADDGMGGQTYIGTSYGVLIAQVTVEGLSGDGPAGTFSALLQGKLANGDTWQGSTSDFSYGGIPAPGALALLGLAGIAGRRRRR
jgi:MYXO-CTERM domain-containing protein